MKERLDIILVKRGLVESRTKAQWLIKKGFVFVEKERMTKVSKRVDSSEEIF